MIITKNNYYKSTDAEKDIDRNEKDRKRAKCRKKWGNTGIHLREENKQKM